MPVSVSGYFPADASDIEVCEAGVDGGALVVEGDLVCIRGKTVEG